MRETYDDLEWEINEFPIGSSTPDDLFENSYRASTRCPDCGNSIEGTANYWSRYEDMSNDWLNSIDYTPCDCGDSHEDEEYEDDDEV